MPRVRRRIPARQPLRTGPPLRLRAGGGGSVIGVRGPNSRRVAGDRGRAFRAWKEKGRGEGYWKLLWDFLGFFVFSSPTFLALGEEA